MRKDWRRQGEGGKSNWVSSSEIGVSDCRIGDSHHQPTWVVNCHWRSKPSLPRVVGLCYCCAALGHLSAHCLAKKKMHPFCQPVVSKAEVIDTAVFDVGINDSYDDLSVYKRFDQ